MLSTVRVKANCFQAIERRLNLSAARALLIACNRTDERATAFDDLQVVTV